MTGLVVLIGTALSPHAVVALDAPRSAISLVASFEDIKEIGELRHLFNADEGTPRLILLLSPT